MGAASDVSEGLIDGDPLDQWREIFDHTDRGIAQPLIVLEVAADEDEPGAKFARLPAGHAAMHAEGFRLIGSGEHDAAAHRDRLAFETRIEQLLDRGIEGVEIGMEDGGGAFHSSSPP